MDEILEHSAAVLSQRLASREITAEELMRATLARIEAVNPELNAIVSLRDPEVLLEEARAADAAPRKGWLHGIPMAVKDLADVAGIRTSSGSKLFQDHVAAGDSLLAARLRASGAIFIGKTNVPEFGLGSNTFNQVHGATQNAYDAALTCGGSSGGAGAALAARLLAVADGSDVMGSLRNPAGWNNVYGFRPSWGRVPGEPAGERFLHQLSTNGPMARCPVDLAGLLDVMAGPDPRQPHGLAYEAMTGRLDAPVEGRRIAWLGDWGGALPMERGILELCEKALEQMQQTGVVVETPPPPFPAKAIWESWITLRSWAIACNHGALYEDTKKRKHLKREAIWEIERGLALSGREIQAASEIRSDWFRAAAKLFEEYDAFAMPTAQVWPFPIDWRYPASVNGVEMDTYHRWMEVVLPASLIGLPALSVPAGFGENGLPMGLQLVGPARGDLGVLQLGQAWHALSDWPSRRPPERFA